MNSGRESRFVGLLGGCYIVPFTADTCAHPLPGRLGLWVCQCLSKLWKCLYPPLRSQVTGQGPRFIHPRSHTPPRERMDGHVIHHDPSAPRKREGTYGAQTLRSRTSSLSVSVVSNIVWGSAGPSVVQTRIEVKTGRHGAQGMRHRVGG